MISVIIPCYNHASALPGLIASLNQQTYKEFEIIIIDDGSTDDPESVVGELKKKFYNLPIKFVSTANQGAPAARNTGAKIAHGQFLFFADADLILEPDALKTLLDKLCDNPQCSYAYSAFKFGRKLFPMVKFDVRTLKRINFIHTSALIRREHFPGFDERLKRFQDWDLWLSMLKQGHIGIGVEKCLFTARVTRLGISKWRPKIWYKLWPIMGYTPATVQKYLEAKKIIHQKYG